MTIKLFTSLALLSMLTVADSYKYDFSTEKAPLRDGFTRITEQAFKVDDGTAKANFTPFSYEWIKDGYGRPSPPANYPIDITAGHVQGRGTATVTLPAISAGRYHVWAVCGLGGGNNNNVWDILLKLGSGTGQLTFNGNREIMDMDFETELTGGPQTMTVSSRSTWVINALVIVPESEWKTVKNGWLKDLREEIFILPKEVRAQWKYTPIKGNAPEPHWTDQQKQQGFAVYSRPWVEPVWPDHFPYAHELKQTPRAFASWDEYEPMTFTLYPLKDFDKVDVDISDLSDGKGNSIGKEDITVRYVRYMYVRPNYISHGTYYRAPDVLMPWSPRELTSGENLRIWLDIHVPLYIPAGIYKGEARLTLDGQKATVPLLFRVLPITLLKDETLGFGQYYYHPYEGAFKADNSFSRRWHQRRAEAEFADMNRYGNNLVTGSLWGEYVNGKFQIRTYDRFQHIVDLYRKAGFTKPIPCGFAVGGVYYKYIKASMGPHISNIQIPPDAFFDEITQVVTDIQAEAKRRQWPELLYYPIDEPSSSPDGVEFMRRILMAIKKVPGVRTYITADPSYDAFQPLKPYVDVWCCQPFALPREQIVKEMAERPGLEYWCYPNHISGENDHTPTKGARMTYGFGFWNSGFRCLVPWVYSSFSSSQWNNLDAKTADFCNRTDMDGTPIPVTLWIAYREGYDDGRYINTLEKWISRAADAGFTEQAQEAKKDLELLRSSIKVQLKYKENDLWNAETYDTYRWLLARHILKLQALF